MKQALGFAGVVLLAAAAAAAAMSQEEQTAKALELVDPKFITDGELDLDAVIEHFEDLYRADSSIAVADLTVTQPRNTRSLEMKVWTKGDEKALIVIQAPPREKGTATLKVDKNLWNYLPKIKRTIRIPPSMMQASWMGSDFTNDDLVKESSLLEDYSYELVGYSEAPKGWQVRFTAKPDVIGLWEKFDVFLSEDATIPIEAAYYDRKGRLARNLYWDQVGELGGKTLPTRMTLVPVEPEGHKTVLIYKDLQFDANNPDSLFSLSHLERKR